MWPDYLPSDWKNLPPRLLLVTCLVREHQRQMHFSLRYVTYIIYFIILSDTMTFLFVFIRRRIYQACSLPTGKVVGQPNTLELHLLRTRRDVFLEPLSGEWPALRVALSNLIIFDPDRPFSLMEFVPQQTESTVSQNEDNHCIYTSIYSCWSSIFQNNWSTFMFDH